MLLWVRDTVREGDGGVDGPEPDSGGGGIVDRRGTTDQILGPPKTDRTTRPPDGGTGTVRKLYENQPC